jgi:carbon monoxide dehydrogenase subunit G
MEDRNNNNMRMDIQSEVVRYEPDRLIETKVEATGGFTGDVRYELEPMDGTRTRLTYRANYQFDHWLAKLLEPVISRSAQQKLDEDIARLKQQVEAE